METQAPSVLVIDDSEFARAKISAVLSDAGMRVVTLASPIGATRAVMENDVGVVVVDIMMPGMRGDRLATLFRRNPRFKHLGVILVSGAAQSELENLSLEVSADATVAKSQLDELVPAVRRLWSRYRLMTG